MRRRPDVLIVGAGVSGLSCALRLAQEHVTVEVWARELPLQTTSCAAAAMWAPYLVTDTRLEQWSRLTRTTLLGFGADEGVRHVRGREVARTPVAAPSWMSELPTFRACAPDELPDGFVTGWWYEAPVVDMPVYVAELLRRLTDLGVRVRQATVDSLDEVLHRAAVVVNCTGVDARWLAADESVTPTRGQLVVVENPGIDAFFAEHDESSAPTYFLPHGPRMVLGGSAEPGRADRTPDVGTAEAIRARCAVIEPSLARARVLQHRVGLRPARPRVRVQRVGRVVHNYGHGGAGVTLSWGCAEEVLTLVGEVL